MIWNNMLRENLVNTKDLMKFIKFTPEEAAKMDEILDKYPMSIPSYYLSLIDFHDPQDPIRKMCIPSIDETDLGGSFDTSGEASNTVIVGMQHKYRESAMVLSTNHCAMYCRHCFRKRLVGLTDDEIAKYFDNIIVYIKEHKEISNVLISGGDSFLNSNETIEKYLNALSCIEHLDFIRFGTRVPVVFPQRITEDTELQGILQKYTQKKQIYVVTQYNHPKELAEESVSAIKCLLNMGIPVKNQTVLLKGVNDDPAILGLLLKKLTQYGVIPYYIFQCRPVTGVKNQFQVPFLKGYEIVEQATNMQNGQGKCFKYALSHETGKIEVVGRIDGNKMIFKYHQAKDLKDQGKLFIKELTEDDCWLDIVP